MVPTSQFKFFTLLGIKNKNLYMRQFIGRDPNTRLRSRMCRVERGCLHFLLMFVFFDFLYYFSFVFQQSSTVIVLLVFIFLFNDAQCFHGELNNREKKTMINSLRLFLNSERLIIFMSISSGSILSLFCGTEFAVSERTRIEHVLTICCQKHSNFIPIEWGEVYM